MKITSTRTTQFQARIRIILKRKIRRILGKKYSTDFVTDMSKNELEQFFNTLKYGR